MHTCALRAHNVILLTRVTKCARTGLRLVCARLCTDLYETYCGSLLVSYELKFQISWRSKLWLRRYICKTIMTFVWSLIFYVFCIFSNLSIKIPSKCENYMKLVGTYGNYLSKCPGINENMAPIFYHTMVLLKRSYLKILFVAFIM